MKIVSTGSTLASPEFYRKKQKEKRLRLIFGVIGFIVIASLLVFVSRMERFRISALAVEGAKGISSEEIEKMAKEALSGYYFYLVPKDSSFLYSKDRLEGALYTAFPRFSSVETSLVSLEELQVRVSEREPFALYCGEAISLTNAPVCYFLDSEGYIFDSAPMFSEGVYFVYASSEPLEEPRGKQFLPAEEFKNIARFVEGLKSLNLEPLALKLSYDQFEVFLPHSARIIVNRNSNLALIYSNLESFLANEAIRSQKNFRENLSELDLRTENKVFWKVK